MSIKTLQESLKKEKDGTKIGKTRNVISQTKNRILYHVRANATENQVQQFRQRTQRIVLALV